MSAPAARGTQGLFKRAWNEIPDVVGGSIMALIGLGLAGIGLSTYHAKNGENPRYKFGYVVMRPDDPRADKVRKD